MSRFFLLIIILISGLGYAQVEEENIIKIDKFNTVSFDEIFKIKKDRDSIKHIEYLLNTFSSNLYASNYLKKYIISDSSFLKYADKYNKTEWSDERIKKRNDLAILFYIHFELYLKYKKPEKYNIVNIYLSPEDCRFSKTYTGSRIIVREPPYCEIGNKYIDTEVIDADLLSNYYYPDHEKMKKIYNSYKDWITKVKKMGSLEKARKKELNPLKGTNIRWVIDYFNKENGNFKNSFFPRYKNRKRIYVPQEVTFKEWISSYR